MEFFEAVNERCSYRGVYEKSPVPREDLRKILEAGLAAPSGCNMQTTRLVAIDEPELVGKLGGMLKKSSFGTAPAAVIVLTREEISYGGVSYHVQDYSAAIQNMLLSITALGYASCWVEGYVAGYPEISKAMAKELGAPEGYWAAAYLPVGKPAEELKHVEKLSFEKRAGFNGFSGGEL